MPTFLFALLFYVFPSGFVIYDPTQKLVLIVFVLAATFVIPALSTVYLKATKVISSYTMKDQKERIYPFIMVSLVYCGTTILFYTKYDQDYFLFISKVLAVISFNVIVSTIVTFFWKISIHSVGIGGLSGLLLSFIVLQSGEFKVWPLVALFVLSGIVMSARPLCFIT